MCLLYNLPRRQTLAAHTSSVCICMYVPIELIRVCHALYVDSGRIGIAGQALGIAQASLDCAAAYALQRKSFDKPISSLYAIQEKLADISTRIDAAR